mgnify:CR=1 FL=1
MENSKNKGISFFEKYLTLWVAMCMVIGVLIGKFLPWIPAFLGRFEYANVSIPIAILIWLMIYPMMLKVDFKSIKDVGKNPKGLFVTWVTNWLIKPFTMFGIAWLFFFVIFKTFIPGELSKDYLAGTILLGAAPCTAMVFVLTLVIIFSFQGMEATQRPKLLEELPVIDVAVTMGCNVECPYLLCKRREGWGLNDPTGMPDDEFIAVIKKIESKIHVLKVELAAL